MVPGPASGGIAAASSGPHRPGASILIFNPAAGRGRGARRVQRIGQILRLGGFEVETLPTSGPGHAAELARGAAASGAGTVFAFGGDGTLREAAKGLLGTRVPVGFLPAGTANVMSLALGLPRHPLRAAAGLCRAVVREIDVGLCGGEPFLMQASAGLDAFVLARLGPAYKRRTGRFGIGLAAAAASVRYTYPAIELNVDGVRLEAGFVAVCNIPFYGGRWRLVPGARFDDRRLDLLVCRARGRLATAAFARDLFLGRRHLVRADVELYPVRERVEILGPSDLPLQIDGDPFPGSPPVAIELASSRLRVLAAREREASAGATPGR